MASLTPITRQVNLYDISDKEKLCATCKNYSVCPHDNGKDRYNGGIGCGVRVTADDDWASKRWWFAVTAGPYDKDKASSVCYDCPLPIGLVLRGYKCYSCIEEIKNYGPQNRTVFMAKHYAPKEE